MPQNQTLNALLGSLEFYEAPKRTGVTFTCDDDVLEAIEELAEFANCSRSEFLRFVLRTYVIPMRDDKRSSTYTKDDK